jgi:branched-chain amino acid transport system substrate-binding protein
MFGRGTRTKRFLIAPVIALFAIFVGAASGSQHTAAKTVTLTIGDFHDITGGASFYGIGNSHGVALGADDINKKGGIKAGGTTYKLKVMTADTASSPTSAVAALKSLQSSGVKYIFGPLSSGVLPAVLPIMQAATDTLFVVDGSSKGGITNGTNIFRDKATIQFYDVATINYLKKKKFASAFYLVDQTNASYFGSQNTFKKTMENAGTKTAGTEYFKLGDTDFSAQLTKARSANPSVLVIRGYPAEAATITKAAENLGIPGSSIVWETLALSATVKTLIGDSQMNGVVGCAEANMETLLASNAPGAKALEAANQAKYHEAAGPLTALSYDAVHIVAAAMTKAKSVDVSKVSAAMRSLKPKDVATVNSYLPTNGRLFGHGQVKAVASCTIWNNGGWKGF